MVKGLRTHPPPSAVEVVEENGAKSDEADEQRQYGGWRGDMARVVVRVMTVAASVIALSLMVTARETSIASFYGFRLQLHSNWSFATSFQYLVGVSAAATAYSLAQLLISGLKLWRESPIISSRFQAWLCFLADQIFGYAMMSAASAALGVTNLNRTGIKHAALPNFCKSLESFCDHVAVSVVFALLSCLLLAASAVQDVVLLYE